MTRFFETAIAVVLALCSPLAVGQDSIQQRFERSLQAELGEGISPEIVPVPDPQFAGQQGDESKQGDESQSGDLRPPLAVRYERPDSVAKAVDSDGMYFVRWSASWCGPCRQMESSGVFQHIKDAGFPLTEIDIDKNPDPRVKTVPQLWLCDADRKPVRIWVGLQTADDIFKPVECVSTVRINAAGSMLSGFVVAPNLVVTCAHHEQTAGILIEFPIDSFQVSRFVTVPARIVKTDVRADLQLLEFTPPPAVTLDPLELAESWAPRSVSGFAFGTEAKTVTLQNLNQTAGDPGGGPSLRIAKGDGIRKPQSGMSGGPVIDADGNVCGVQSAGRNADVLCISPETLAKFLEGVSLGDAPAMMTLESADGYQVAELLAASLSVHCLQEYSDQMPQAEAFGSLISLDLDAPDPMLAIARKVLAAESIDFPAAGVSLDWSGAGRSIELQPGRVAIRPGVAMTVSKFGFTKRCRLDAIAYADDLSSVTFELSGMLDLTVNLR